MLIRPSLSSELASLRRTSRFIPPLAPSTSAWTGTFAATAAVIVAAEFVVVAEALAPVAPVALVAPVAVAVVAEAVVAAAAVAAEPVELAAKPFAVAAVATAEPVVAAAAVPAEPVEVPETPAAAGAVAAEAAVAAVATAEPVAAEAVVADVPRIQAASAGLTAAGIASTIPTQVAMESDLADGIVKSHVCCIVEAALYSATSLALPHSRIRATHSWVPDRLPRACVACRHCAELPSGRIPKARI
ncbi:hypothetical protein K456DRAFT_1488446 [Colletotrichum gloeosporioides 23]|nr:hypothetical protein K456DRAFT_1488446 [Colletotrichum gloeosporioides 23]